MRKEWEYFETKHKSDNWLDWRRCEKKNLHTQEYLRSLAMKIKVQFNYRKIENHKHFINQFIMKVYLWVEDMDERKKRRRDEEKSSFLIKKSINFTGLVLLVLVFATSSSFSFFFLAFFY